MNINTGPPVTDSDFYNRKRELQRMDETLRKPGTNIFITRKNHLLWWWWLTPGPRRIGKSSIVKEFMRINEKRMNILYFDLESRKSIIELCTDLAREIKARFPQLIKNNRDLKRVWNTLSQMLPELKIGEVQGKTGQIENQEQDFMTSLENILNILN